MLLKYGIGEESAAKRIEAAVLDTLERGFRTGDIYSAGCVRIFSLALSLFYFIVVVASGKRYIYQPNQTDTYQQDQNIWGEKG